MWDETIASHSGFFVSKSTNIISNLLNNGPESVVLTDKARKNRKKYKLTKNQNLILKKYDIITNELYSLLLVLNMTIFF